ncbi:Extracellular solute-binding protein family 5 [metagenome]|uniref:Extracellular solute-binding protein family 5 n=1 Tax=metagenome TaxID=256318 RepID=A0A2P2CDD5_9ZZZZ
MTTRPHHSFTKVAGLLAATALVASATTACSSAVAEQRGGGSTGGERVLRIGATNDIVPATVFTNSSDTVNTLIGSVYDSLVDYPLDSVEPQPSLATDWTLSDDGTSLTLNLRDDVTFHSGRDLTSKDVEFSIRTWADPTWTVQLQRTAAAVTGFDTSDPHAITLELAHPLSNIFDLLDMVPILDSESFDQLKTGEAYVGTGPFTFESWTPNAKVELAANEDYWGGAPEVDKVEIDIISDPQGQVSALRSGQVDLITGASNRDLAALAEDDAFDVEKGTGADQQIYVGANVANPLLEDVRLRQAVAYALDRERIVDEVFQGQGVPNSLPWAETSLAYDAEQAGRYFRDVAKAKKLVAEVGGTTSLPLTYPAGNANYEAVAQIVQANLEEVGIPTELVPVEYTQFIKQLIGGEFEGLWILQHNYAQFTPSTLAVSAYPFNADKNASHFVDDDYKAHAEAAWKRPDGTDEEALAIYRELNEDLLDNAFLLEIATLAPQVATTAGVSGYTWSKRAELQLDDVTFGG